MAYFRLQSALATCQQSQLDCPRGRDGMATYRTQAAMFTDAKPAETAVSFLSYTFGLAAWVLHASAMYMENLEVLS